MRTTSNKCFIVALDVENNARQSATNLNVSVRHLTQAPFLFPVVLVFVSICVSSVIHVYPSRCCPPPLSFSFCPIFPLMHLPGLFLHLKHYDVVPLLSILP